jgi:hypothetical protein
MWNELISLNSSSTKKTERRFRKKFRVENLGFLNKAAG